MGFRRYTHSAVGLALLVGLAGAGVALPGLSSTAQAADPTEYGVTIRRIEFRNSAGVWVPYFEGSQLIDIAAANAGDQAGSIGAGDGLPPGSYTAMRVTVEQTFVLTADDSSVSGFCTGGANDTNTAVACPPGSPTSQRVPIPATGGPPASTANTVATIGWEEVVAGQTMQKELAVSFTVPEGEAFEPDFSISFSVAGAADFATVAGQVYPADPEVEAE